MDSKINKKIDLYNIDFKNKIKNWFILNDCQISGNKNLSDFLKFIYDFDNLILDKKDFQKRNRVKNVLPDENRCCAKRANGEQCTRRKKDNCEFCGTHEKGLPYGRIEINEDEICVVKENKVEVWVQDIKGIYYYIDSENNIYDSSEVLENYINPKIIGKYFIDKNGNYNIDKINS